MTEINRRRFMTGAACAAITVALPITGDGAELQSMAHPVMPRHWRWVTSEALEQGGWDNISYCIERVMMDYDMILISYDPGQGLQRSKPSLSYQTPAPS